MIAALVTAAALSLPAAELPDLSVTAGTGTVNATHGSSCTTSSGSTLCADKAWPRPGDQTATLHVAAGERLTLVPDASATLDGSSLFREDGSGGLANFGAAAQVTLPASMPLVTYLSIGTRWTRGADHGDIAYLVRLVRDVPPVVPPEITVSAAAGTMKTTALGGCQVGGGVTVCGQSPPAWEAKSLASLRAAAGETLTVDADPAISSLTGTVTDGRGHTLASLSGSSMRLPARMPAQAWLVLTSKWTREGVQGDGPSALRLERAPAALAKAGAIHRGAVRLRWTVSCAKSAGRACAGISTVRAHGRVVARKTFSGLAAGERRALTALIRPAAKRYLRNHPSVALRATVSRAGA
jgi:hypothetical protein